MLLLLHFLFSFQYTVINKGKKNLAHDQPDLITQKRECKENLKTDYIIIEAACTKMGQHLVCSKMS